MQVDHLASPFLSILLLPSLRRGCPSRVVNVNSVMHFVGFVDPEGMNVMSGKRKNSSLVGYSSIKLAQVMFSSVLHKRLPAEAGINLVCLSPGMVLTNVHILPGDIQSTSENSKHVRRHTGWWYTEGKKYPKFFASRVIISYLLIFDPQEGFRSSLFAVNEMVPEYCALLKSNDWPVSISHYFQPMNASEEAHNLETSNMVWAKTLELSGLSSDMVEKSF